MEEKWRKSGGKVEENVGVGYNNVRKMLEVDGKSVSAGKKVEGKYCKSEEK